MVDTFPLLFSPRIRTRELAQLCRRLSTSLSAGIDLRATWKREAAGSGRSVVLYRFRVIRDTVAASGSMADGIEQCGDFFPELFRQLAKVGDETGSGAEVYGRLAEHYDAQIKRRRVFMAAITWPMVQLVASLLVVGFVIWVMGMIGDKKTDIFGFGLIGNKGLALYVAFLSGVGIALVLLLRAFHRGMMWVRPVQRLVWKLPVIGPALETLALSQLAWVLHLTMNTGMDVRQAIRLSLKSTNHDRYIDQIPVIERWIAQGGSIYEAFIEAGDYPPEFLDALHVGEESGRLVESMENLSKQYQDRARMALAALMTVAGFLVWAFVALLIILMIFRIFMFYIGAINNELSMWPA